MIKNEKVKIYDVTDEELKYRKENHIDDNQKIFFASESYPDIVNYFLDQGWYRADDYEIPYIDFKYSLKKRINYTILQDYQMVGLFQDDSLLCRKEYFVNTIKNCMWNTSSDYKEYLNL